MVACFDEAAIEAIDLFLDMAVASKVVSKRSARLFVEDETAKETYDPHTRKTTLKLEEVRVDEVESTSSSSSSTSQEGVDVSTADPTEAGGAEPDSDNRNVSDQDSGDHTVGVDPGKLAGPRQAFTFPRVFNTQPHGLPAGQYPANFGVVVPGVYRSSYPQPQNYGFLKDLRLKTIM